ncbi:hypothetical protein [Pseudanabaena sp. ABRG5-3]|uniref:hypothetical protein n=1 Tax=Pseudanabaena sp. ABRG5-3 TaxID=685565 RepID=UPI000F848886|nr:hypothetical protein [Pseudanabaena sp. ABRG5-3]
MGLYLFIQSLKGFWKGENQHRAVNLPKLQLRQFRAKSDRSSKLKITITSPQKIKPRSHS